MPTYDYVCSACGHAFEAFQDMSAKKLRKCPACGKSALERQVGAGAGLIFKGSGFYITDYKRSGGGEAPAGKAEPGAPAAGGAPGASSAAEGGARPGASSPSTGPTPPAAPASPPAAAPAAPRSPGKRGSGAKGA